MVLKRPLEFLPECCIRTFPGRIQLSGFCTPTIFKPTLPQSRRDQVPSRVNQDLKLLDSVDEILFKC